MITETRVGTFVTSDSLEEFLASPRITPYRYDKARVGPTPNEKFTHMIHIMETSAAVFAMRPVTVIPSKEEIAAMNRTVSDWNNPFERNGD